LLVVTEAEAGPESVNPSAPTVTVTTTSVDAGDEKPEVLKVDLKLPANLAL